ncbi:MAG TPA: acetyltransferase [Solirubrobacteraceae bacterium]|jgi:sugar O-acyltransferase (sialic acid O-acetyltransferase NeuD family)|nr:acetyltransferase [Solirubrobacteraceae bacterium]
MSDVVIFGTGDYGRIAHRYLQADSPHEVVAFTVHRAYVEHETLNGLPTIPFEDLPGAHPPGSVALLVAAGFSKVNQVRSQIFAECKGLGYECISYQSSDAMIWDDVPIGENSFIFEANVVQPGVTIGENVVLWSGNHIGHDSTIGDHCFIASHAVISGNCHIGDHCFVGVNATFRDGVTVAPRCVIGAGALIMKNTEEGGVYSTRGTEAHKLKSWELKGF